MKDKTNIPPTSEEAKSQKVAKHLVYASRQLGQYVPAFVKNAAQNEYGDTNQLEVMEVMLSDLIGSMKDSEKQFILYNGRNADARTLLSWYQDKTEPPT